MLTPNDIIGARRYKVLSKIGGGGMATLYKVQDSFKDVFAAKLLNIDLARSEPDSYSHFINCFKREAEVLRALQNPSIPKIIDSFPWPINGTDSYAIIMQYVDGQTLKDRLDARKKPFTEQWTADYARKICDPLQHAHSLDIIHRDLKLANIMIDAEGTVFLIDWGIAKLLKAQAAGGKTEVVGTDFCCPIEQYMPNAPKDARTDIYAFGATIVNMLTGDFPKDNAVTRKVYEEQNHKPHKIIIPGVTQGLEELVNWMMGVDPDARPFSVAIVEQELTKLLKSYSSPTSYSQTPSGYQIPPLTHPPITPIPPAPSGPTPPTNPLWTPVTSFDDMLNSFGLPQTASQLDSLLLPSQKTSPNVQQYPRPYTGQQNPPNQQNSSGQPSAQSDPFGAAQFAQSLQNGLQSGTHPFLNRHQTPLPVPSSTSPLSPPANQQLTYNKKSDFSFHFERWVDAYGVYGPISKKNHSSGRLFWQRDNLMPNKRIVGLESADDFIFVAGINPRHAKDNEVKLYTLQELLYRRQQNPGIYSSETRISAMKIFDNYLFIGHENGKVVAIDLLKWLPTRPGIDSHNDPEVAGTIQVCDAVKNFEFYKNHLMIQDEKFLTTIDFGKMSKDPRLRHIEAKNTSPAFCSRVPTDSFAYGLKFREHNVLPELFFNFRNSLGSIPLDNLRTDDARFHVPPLIYPKTHSDVKFVDLYNEYLIAHPGDNIIRVMDKSKSAHPQLFGARPFDVLRILSDKINCLELTGDYLSIATDNGYLRVVDIKDAITNLEQHGKNEFDVRQDFLERDPTINYSKDSLLLGTFDADSSPVRHVKTVGPEYNHLAVISGDSDLTILEAFKTRKK